MQKSSYLKSIFGTLKRIAKTSHFGSVGKLVESIVKEASEQAHLGAPEGIQIGKRTIKTNAKHFFKHFRKVLKT